jgi:hypothetical protein
MRLYREDKALLKPKRIERAIKVETVLPKRDLSNYVVINSKENYTLTSISKKEYVVIMMPGHTCVISIFGRVADTGANFSLVKRFNGNGSRLVKTNTFLGDGGAKWYVPETEAAFWRGISYNLTIQNIASDFERHGWMQEVDTTIRDINATQLTVDLLDQDLDFWEITQDGLVPTKNYAQFLHDNEFEKIHAYKMHSLSTQQEINFNLQSNNTDLFHQIADVYDDESRETFERQFQHDYIDQNYKGKVFKMKLDGNHKLLFYNNNQYLIQPKLSSDWNYFSKDFI